MIEFRTIFERLQRISSSNVVSDRSNSIFSDAFRRRNVIRIDALIDHFRSIKIHQEKVQRKVDHALTQSDDQSKIIEQTTDSKTLRSLRHHYLQAKIPRDQLRLLIEQGGWSEQIAEQFQNELNLVDSQNSLELIRHLRREIVRLFNENGAVDQNILQEHFQNHFILIDADFKFLLKRSGLIALKDLNDLLLVCRLIKPNQIESYGKSMFALNVGFLAFSQI